jgi:hypothetical protein
MSTHSKFNSYKVGEINNVEVEFKFLWEFFFSPMVSSNVGVLKQEKVEKYEDVYKVTEP